MGASVVASSVHVVLIDGLRLAELMARSKVGVVARETVELKSVDEGFSPTELGKVGVWTADRAPQVSAHQPDTLRKIAKIYSDPGFLIF